MTHIEDIELLADIGVALLLFALGLEVSLRDLRPVRRIALIGGPVQVVVTALFGAGLAMAVTGMARSEAAWFGAMVALSSTMVVLKILAATGTTTTTLASRVMIGLLVVQGLAVVPMLIVLPQLGCRGDVWSGVARAAGVATLFLVGMVLVGTRALPALLRRVGRLGSRELFLVAVVAAGVGIGSIACGDANLPLRDPRRGASAGVGEPCRGDGLWGNGARGGGRAAARGSPLCRRRPAPMASTATLANQRRRLPCAFVRVHDLGSGLVCIER